ncbi:MAG TPA: GGDEF domain-containing protein [Thermoanaerobaculia bacterium]|nr:GGDEF domain-containing protein [Thermoanaerobaculia bacterium]
MEFSNLGLLVQTIGAFLLAMILLYLSRGKGNRVLKAAGLAYVFLFLSLVALFISFDLRMTLGNVPYLYLKILSMTAFIVAAQRMEKDVPLGKPLARVGIAALPVVFVIVLFADNSLFYAIHIGLLAIGWVIVTVLIFKSRGTGLGKRFTGLLAALTAVVQLVFVVFFAVSASQADGSFAFPAYTGFYDLFLEMLVGIGLIIWAMEDTEVRLATIHQRAVDDTQRTRRRAQIDPLTEAYNRFFLEELRPTLARDPLGGTIVLIDVDGLKAINDLEGHEEGDKAIWTVAAAIKTLIRGNDFLIRWGGDEFLVILPGMDEEVVKKRLYMLPSKIEEIRQAPRAAQAYRKFLTASVGVTAFSTRVPFDMAIESADRLMYERKKAHKQMRGTTDSRRVRRDTPGRDNPGRNTR